jgi:hypothetical protein
VIEIILPTANIQFGFIMPENKIGILFNNTVLSFQGFENKLTFLCGGLIQSDTVQSLVLDHLEVVGE